MAKRPRPSGDTKTPKVKKPKESVIGRVSLEKDPRVYAMGVRPRAPLYKRLVGIDLGTSTGVAWCDFVPGHPIVSARMVIGQWSLDLGRYDSGPLRHVRLQQFLSVLSPDVILFENVKYDAPVASFLGKPIGAIVARVVPTAEFLGGLKTTLATWAELHDVACQGVEIAEIKRWLTQKGNASKVDMIQACNARFGTTLDPETYESTGADNMADAAAICGMGLELYSDGLNSCVPL